MEIKLEKNGNDGLLSTGVWGIEGERMKIAPEISDGLNKNIQRQLKNKTIQVLTEGQSTLFERQFRKNFHESNGLI